MALSADRMRPCALMLFYHRGAGDAIGWRAIE
jgi:hypothetical protein